MLRKRNCYTASFKLAVVAFAEGSNNSAAARHFSVNEKQVRDWRKKHAELKQMPKFKKAARGRRPMFQALEEKLSDWIQKSRMSGLVVTRTAIRIRALKLKKETEFAEKKPKDFVASVGWYSRFMKRNNLCIRGIQQKGVKRKHSELEKDTLSEEIHSQPLEKWNSQLNEWEAVGVNVFKKLQRMDPNQALYAESLITKVLRLGLLHSLTPETDVGLRPQYVQDFTPSVSSLCNNLETHVTTPMYTQQSVGNSTFSNTVPLSTSFPAITTSSPAFVTDHNAAVIDQSLTQNNLTLTTPNTVGGHQNTTQNNASSVIQSTVISFKAEPLDDSLS